MRGGGGVERDEDGLPITTYDDLLPLPPRLVAQTSQQAEVKRVQTRKEQGLCDARAWVDIHSDSYQVSCELPDNHDDPMAEVGSRQRVPFHRAEEVVGNVTVTHTWPSERE